jgi:hypothetical protein
VHRKRLARDAHTALPACVAAAAAVSEDPYEDRTDQLVDLIRILQQRDVRAQQLQAQASTTRPNKSGAWNVVDGLLYKGKALYIPSDSAVCSQVMRIHHDDALAGHFGRAKTLELISRKYYWIRMRKDVEQYVKSCIVC